MTVTVKAYAKINLLLDILGTLPNGYHDLFMLMQSVGIYDIIKVTEADDGKITIKCDTDGVPTDEKNIAHKAAVCFFEYTKKENKGLLIEIEKHIPHAAGLAGGSADGAAVIRALQKMYAPELSDREICEIGSMFGSDVPFCALGGTMLAQNTGTVLTYMPQLSLPYIVICKPDCGVSTKEAYAAFDTADHIRHLDRGGIFRAVIDGDTDRLFHAVGNVFEQFIDVPERVTIKAVMREKGAKCACMSGSGPSVFGIFEKEEDAKECYEALIKDFPDTFLCESKEKGVEFI